MAKKIKLKIEDLKVQSLVTSLEKEEKHTHQGGRLGVLPHDTYTVSPPNCPHCFAGDIGDIDAQLRNN